jgi:hypothetical protein
MKLGETGKTCSLCSRLRYRISRQSPVRDAEEELGNELHQETQTDRNGGEAEWKMRIQKIKEKWIRRRKVKDATHRPV